MYILLLLWGRNSHGSLFKSFLYPLPPIEILKNAIGHYNSSADCVTKFVFYYTNPTPLTTDLTRLNESLYIHVLISCIN